MKYILFLLPFFLITKGCPDKKQLPMSIEFPKKFTHTIPNCNPVPAEVNCTEFIQFHSDTRASILLGGSDMVDVGRYQIEKGILTYISEQFLQNEQITFRIESKSSLRRIENDAIFVSE